MSAAGLHADRPSYGSSSAAEEVPPDERDLFKKDRPVFFIQAEYLCWKVNEGALDYALKMHHPAWSELVHTEAVGHFQNAEFDWSSGFRIAFGYFRAPHFWDMFLQYTYLPSFGSNQAHAPHASNEYLNSTFSQPPLNLQGSPSLQHATSRISLKYHVLDWLVSRRFFPNEHLRWNLFGGVTSAFIDQKWNIFYQDTRNMHSKIRNRWQFEGLGLKLGTKMDWYLGWDLYLSGLASSGILSGWYKNIAYQKVQDLIIAVDTSIPFRDTHVHDARLAYTAQMMGGLSWQKAYESVRAEIGVGYEFNIWANLHQIYRSNSSAATNFKQTFINDSLLTLQGFTVRANLDF